jgi:hypothetical protein
MQISRRRLLAVFYMQVIVAISIANKQYSLILIY